MNNIKKFESFNLSIDNDKNKNYKEELRQVAETIRKIEVKYGVNLGDVTVSRLQKLAGSDIF
jgi:hypothetical protein